MLTKKDYKTLTDAMNIFKREIVELSKNFSEKTESVEPYHTLADYNNMVIKLFAYSSVAQQQDESSTEEIDYSLVYRILTLKFSYAQSSLVDQLISCRVFVDGIQYVDIKDYLNKVIDEIHELEERYVSAEKLSELLKISVEDFKQIISDYNIYKASVPVYDVYYYSQLFYKFKTKLINNFNKVNFIK